MLFYWQQFLPLASFLSTHLKMEMAGSTVIYFIMFWRKKVSFQKG